MRSLHHEIEALQKRILSRLNSNPVDISSNSSALQLPSWADDM
jgi:hypothetical protein